MEYMILIHSDENFEMPADGATGVGATMEEWMAYNQMLIDGGHWVSGASLMPTATATTLQKTLGGATTTTMSMTMTTTTTTTTTMSMSMSMTMTMDIRT